MIRARLVIRDWESDVRPLEITFAAEITEIQKNSLTAGSEFSDYNPNNVPGKRICSIFAGEYQK